MIMTMTQRRNTGQGLHQSPNESGTCTDKFHTVNCNEQKFLFVLQFLTTSMLAAQSGAVIKPVQRIA